MIKTLLTLFCLLTALSANCADVYYYLNTVKTCSIKKLSNNETVGNEKFINRPLEIKKLSRRPNVVVFKIDEGVYITDDRCVAAVKVDHPFANDYYDGDIAEIKNFKPSFLIEADIGYFHISDTKPVADYNVIFPSTNNTTRWGKADPTSYRPGALLNFGIGYEFAPRKFLTVKLRLLFGKKTDPLLLTDLNTQATQSGSWIYSDAFQTVYVGERFYFPYETKWKPSLGGYVGISRLSSTLTDTLVTYDLTSYAPAFLLEGSLDYQLNETMSAAGSVGYEILGKRKLKFSNPDSGENFKTDLGYNNSYLSMGMKFIF